MAGGRLPGRAVAVPDLGRRVAVAQPAAIGQNSIGDHLDQIVTRYVDRHVAVTADVEQRAEVRRERRKRAWLDVLLPDQHHEVVTEHATDEVDEVFVAGHLLESNSLDFHSQTTRPRYDCRAYG